MKHVCELAITGLLLKPVKTRVVPHKVGLISQSEGFVCPVLLHTYYKHTRDGLLKIKVVRFRNFFLIPELVCFNKCLLKATASMAGIAVHSLYYWAWNKRQDCQSYLPRCYNRKCCYWKLTRHSEKSNYDNLSRGNILREDIKLRLQ